jgi:flagellar hook-associated protein FlgK
MTGAGGYRMALTSRTALASLFASYGYTPGLVTDSADVYPAQPQWIDNPTNEGTSGTFGTGWSGTCATGTRVETNGSGCSGTASIVAADGGDPNQTPWQRITPTAVATTGTIYMTKTATGRTLTSGDPDTLEQLAEIRFNAVDATKISGVALWMQGYTGGAITKTATLKLAAYSASTISETVVQQQKFYRVGLSAVNPMKFYAAIGIAANHTGSLGSFDFRCISVRG